MILYILLFFLSIEVVPYIVTILFPNLCWSCTTLGKLHQSLDAKYNLVYISWFSYTALMIYSIYVASQFKNIFLKFTSIVFLIALIYTPTLPITNIINMIMFMFFKNPPFIHDYHTEFPSSVAIENHATTIIDEFKQYTSVYKPECIRKTNPSFKIEVSDKEENCWRALYLKKIGKIDPDMIEHFPTTMSLLKDPQIHNAFFSILDPGVEIPPHIGYYKGYLRYHLGVIIPTGREKAYIVCGGKKYTWKEQQGVLFDDLYLHHVKNPTNQTRVVLYLDIKRKTTSPFLNTLNNIGIYLMEHSLVLQLFLKNQHGQKKIKSA
jgi:beta-hydroxylase